MGQTQSGPEASKGDRPKPEAVPKKEKKEKKKGRCVVVAFIQMLLLNWFGIEILTCDLSLGKTMREMDPKRRHGLIVSESVRLPYNMPRRLQSSVTGQERFEPRSTRTSYSVQYRKDQRIWLTKEDQPVFDHLVQEAEDAHISGENLPLINNWSAFGWKYDEWFQSFLQDVHADQTSYKQLIDYISEPDNRQALQQELAEQGNSEGFFQKLNHLIQCICPPPGIAWTLDGERFFSLIQERLADHLDTIFSLPEHLYECPQMLEQEVLNSMEMEVDLLLSWLD